MVNFFKYISIMFIFTSCMELMHLQKLINNKRTSSAFSINNNSGSPFEKIQIFGSSDLIHEGAYLQVTAIDNGEQISTPILRVKEKNVLPRSLEGNNDSVINLYAVLPIFYENPMEDRRVKLEVISYVNDEKWSIQSTLSNNNSFKLPNNNSFKLQGLKPASEGTYDKLFNSFTSITEANANIYGLSIKEIKSMKSSEMPDYIKPLLVSINLLDSILNKEQLIKTFGLNQEGSEEWKIFEAILSQIGLAKRYDDIATSLKNESYLNDEFHFEPLIRMRGGPNAIDFLVPTKTNTASIVPSCFPPNTPEELDQCMNLAILANVIESLKDDVYLKTAEALISIGGAIPHPGTALFTAMDFFLKMAKVRNKLLKCTLPSEISKIEGELFQNEFHEEGTNLVGQYQNIKITAKNDGLSSEDIKGIIDEVFDPASIVLKPLGKRGSNKIASKLMSDADLTKFAEEILQVIFEKGAKIGAQYIDNSALDYIRSIYSALKNSVADILTELSPLDATEFGPFDITDRKWIDVRALNENVIKVDENAKTFKIIGNKLGCEDDLAVMVRIKQGKFRSYNNINRLLSLPLTLHPIKITAQLPEATVLSTMAGRCFNNAYRIEVEPGETKTFTVDVISAVDDRISAVAERGGMVEIETNHGKSNYDNLTTKTTYTIKYTAPEDDHGFVDAIRIEPLSVSGLRGQPNAPDRSILIVVNVKETEEQFSCSDNIIDQLSLMRMVDDNPNYNGVISICYDKFLKKTHILPANIGVSYANTDSSTINLSFSGSHKDLSADDFDGVNLSGLTINHAGVIFGGMMKVDGKVKAGQRNHSNRTLIMLPNLQEYIWFNETKRVRGPYGPGMVDVPERRTTDVKLKEISGPGSITISRWSTPCYLIGYFKGEVENVQFSGAFKIKLPSTVNAYNIIPNTQMDCFPNILD